MPYNPGVQDISGQLLGKGIAGGAQAWQEAMQEVDRSRKETELMAPIVARAVKMTDAEGKPLMEPSALAEFASGNQTKKRALGVEAQLAVKDYLEQEQRRNENLRLGLETTRVGNEGQRIAQAARDSSDARELEARRVKVSEGELDEIIRRNDLTDAAKLQAIQEARKVTRVPKLAPGEAAVINGQVVKGPPVPQPKTESAPGWAAEAMKNDKDLYWDGTRLKSKTSGFPSLMAPGGESPAPSAAPAKGAGSGAVQPGAIKYHRTTGKPYKWDGKQWVPL